MTRLGERFREAMRRAGAELDEEALAFAVEFCRLAVRSLSLRSAEEAELGRLVEALATRTGLTTGQARTLVRLALAPRHRAALTEDELRAYAARFGAEAAAELRAEQAREMDLAGFALRYGVDGALLLLDSLFSVAAADGIDPDEVERLKQAARELGVDRLLVTALLQKHDPRHARADRHVRLHGDSAVIGRARGCEVELTDPQVAPRHARLVRTDDGWRVLDLRSGRPTVVNGQVVASAPLAPGDRLRIGPYTLRVQGDEVQIDGERAFTSLSVRGLRRDIGPLRILDDVRFTVFTGEVVALVGPSGCGKTTLLNAMSGVAPADEGEVLYDGQDFHALLEADRSLVGVVPQDDLVHPELKVGESLLFSGRLRFGPGVSRDELQAAADRVLEELGIASIREQRIGDALKRGISGGQRKRVNLGQELMTRSTRVLFLDEPTSGLDPRASQDIVRLVRQLADHGRIVFLVTHDLTPEVMVQCDHLLVMVPGGRVAWFGPPDEAARYFGVATPDAIFHLLGERPPEEWARRFRESPDFRKYVATREHLVGLGGVRPEGRPAGPRPRRSRLDQLLTLTRRYWRVKLRDRTGVAVLAVQPPLLAAVMAVVFPEPSAPMLFMLALSALWFGMSASVRELIADRVIWNRERRVGVGVLPYLGSKVAVLGLLVGLQCAALSGILFFTHGMGDYGFSLPLLGLVAVLIGWVGMSLGLLVSASWTSSEAAVGTLPLLLIPQITLSSIMVSIKDMRPLAKALTWLAVQRYSLDAVIKSGKSYAMANPYLKGQWRVENNVRLLFELGLKPTSRAADLGIPLGGLLLIHVAFAALFLGAAAWLVARRGRHPTGRLSRRGRLFRARMA